jgi:hypothetical protein
MEIFQAFGYGKDSVDRDAFEDLLIGAYQLHATGTGESTVSMNRDEDFEGKEWIESVSKACVSVIVKCVNEAV